MTELLDASITYDEEDNSKLKLDFGYKQKPKLIYFIDLFSTI